MVTLFQGCKRSAIKVIPANWNVKNPTQKVAAALMARPWQIYYRFYDPAFKGTRQWGKLIQIKGMNEYATWEERQEVTHDLLEDELQALDEEGHNPITKARMLSAAAPATGGDINQHTPQLVALRFALDRVTVEPDTRRDITGVLNYYEKSAIRLNKYRLPLKDVKRRDIIATLDNCKNLTVTTVKKGVEVTRPKIWNANQFNTYRKYLHVLYAYLEKEEIIEYNPVEKIDKREELRDEDQRRTVLTLEERQRIDEYFRSKPRLKNFYRFLNIFFHSGARPVELLKVQGQHVDLAGQRVKVLIKKGRKGGKRRVPKTIKDVALPYWSEALEGCGLSDYVFSKGLAPGARPIRRDQLSRRWSTHVKKALGIKADLYSLKHLHSTEVIDILLQNQPGSDATAQVAQHNSHTTAAMVVNIYDVNRKKREHNKIKEVGNSFAG